MSVHSCSVIEYSSSGGWCRCVALVHGSTDNEASTYDACIASLDGTCYTRSESVHDVTARLCSDRNAVHDAHCSACIPPYVSMLKLTNEFSSRHVEASSCLSRRESHVWSYIPQRLACCTVRNECVAHAVDHHLTC